MMYMTLLKVGNEIMVRDDTTHEVKMVRDSTVAKEARKLKADGWEVAHKLTATTCWELRKE